ncbi:hypothetical protein LINPERHAP2_LOCUS8939, partial [Linum perenne]
MTLLCLYQEFSNPRGLDTVPDFTRDLSSSILALKSLSKFRNDFCRPAKATLNCLISASSSDTLWTSIPFSSFRSCTSLSSLLYLSLET